MGKVPKEKDPNSKEQKHFDLCGSEIDQAESGKMFGHPVYKLNKKAFVCYFHGDMVFKLDPDTKDRALKLKGSMLFDPSGKKRPMKEWVQLSYTHKKKWSEFSFAAAEYVLSLQK